MSLRPEDHNMADRPVRLILLREHQPRKVFEAAVVGAFRLRGEAAGWQLPLGEMIREAVAADAFFGATAVGTIAPGQVRFFFTIHT